MGKTPETVKPSSGSERLDLPVGLAEIRPVGVDLFFAGLGQETYLPAEIATHPELLKQAAQRRELYLNLGRLFAQVNDAKMEMGEAIKKGLVTLEASTAAYQDLADFIEADSNNERIILYLPFELLPNFNAPIVPPPNLATAQERLRKVYQKAWLRLLHESDVRASFVDGDVLEPSLGEPVRVRKAAHLIPEMLSRGLIQTSDVMEQLELSSENELTQSLAEGFHVAGDENTIPPEVINVVEQADLPKKQLLENLARRLEADLKAIESQYREDSPYVATISPERVKWEKQVKCDETINQAAGKLATALQGVKLGISDIESFCRKTGFNQAYATAGLRGIIFAGESLAVSDLQKAQELAKQSQRLVERYWETGSLEVKDTIISGLVHWQRLDVVGPEILNKLGIQLPDLASPFPVDLENLLAGDLKPIVEAAEEIENHPFLSQYLYPFILLFGSKFKGYAALGADLDGAIFIRSNTPWTKRSEILTQLKQAIPALGKIDKILELWLEEKAGRLGFRTVPEEAETIMGALQIHFLWNGLWLGQGREMRRIYGEIIESYFDLNGSEEQKVELRRHLLGQIELDVLQYRLMHKGYRRFYPNKRSQGSENSHLIDWESDFWDPGYRRVASLLFLSRVFLPNLKIR